MLLHRQDMCQLVEKGIPRERVIGKGTCEAKFIPSADEIMGIDLGLHHAPSDDLMIIFAAFFKDLMNIFSVFVTFCNDLVINFFYVFVAVSFLVSLRRLNLRSPCAREKVPPLFITSFVFQYVS